MANRKITQFPSVLGNTIVDEDLLTIVKIFEVDPTLKNKKITFGEFKNYLDQYYGLNILQGDITISGSLTITGDLDVQGQNSNFVSGNFSDSIFVQNNIEAGAQISAAGTISGNTINGTNANLTNVIVENITGVTFSGIETTFETGTIQNLESTFITGDTVNGTFGTYTFVTGTTLVSGATIVGVTGNFEQLNVNELDVTGNIEVNDLTVTGTVSGATITGDQVLGTSGIFTFLSGETVTGNSFSGTDAVFNTISGETITGDTINATWINVDVLSASGLSFDGNRTISGDLDVLGSGTYASGLTVTGNLEANTLTLLETGVALEMSGIASGVNPTFNGFVIQGPLVILP